jgi:hypothetical protein
MVSQRTRTRATIYFVGMLALNLFLLRHSIGGIRMALPDFTVFYTAGRIVHQGQGAQLYDNEVQEAVQRSFSAAGIAQRGSVLPYNHPPFEALFFAPFARVSYLRAYSCWFAINLLLLISIPVILRPHFAVLGREPVLLWQLAALAFFPNFLAVLSGQDSIFILFCYCMAFAASCRTAEIRMGGWLALGLGKFQLALAFVLPFLVLKRRRLIAGFALVGVFLLFLGWITVGWSGWRAYPGYVLANESDQHYVWTRSLDNTVNLRGLMGSLLPGIDPRFKAALLALLSGLILAGTVYAWKVAATPQDQQRAFSIGLIAAVLLSYHLYAHDLSLMFLAGLITLERTVANPPSGVWTRRLIYACLALLVFNPVYLVLTLRYQQLQWMAGVLLALFVLLWAEFVRSNPVAAAGAESQSTGI